MTLPNGEVLRDGDWGVMREGRAVQIRFEPPDHGFCWVSHSVSYGRRTYLSTGTFCNHGTHELDIIARAPAPSTRPADEMDLTALCKPFGLLHEETKAALREWPHGWQEFYRSDWCNHIPDSWRGSFTYRAKPAPVSIRATIPWEFLVSDIHWVAQDEDGRWYGYATSPTTDENLWVGDDMRDLDFLVFPEGNEHWTKTLQQRPQTGEKP